MASGVQAPNAHVHGSKSRRSLFIWPINAKNREMVGTVAEKVMLKPCNVLTVVAIGRMSDIP